jgi:hypothetical protein
VLASEADDFRDCDHFTLQFVEPFDKNIMRQFIIKENRNLQKLALLFIKRSLVAEG